MMCLTATLAVAQTIEFEYKGNKIAPGSTLYSADYDEMIYNFGNLSFKPEIYILGDDSRTAYVSLHSIVPQSVRWGLCSLDYPNTGCSNPKPEDNYTVTKWGVIAAGRMDLQAELLLGKVDVNETHTYPAEITAWYEGDEANKVTFTLVCTTDKNLVTSVQGAKTQAQAAYDGEGVSYSFVAPAARMLQVCGAGGALVMSAPLSAKEGRVSLVSLPAGVYVWQVTEAGKAVAQGKALRPNLPE